MAYSKEDVKQYILGPEFAPANPNFLTEQNLIRKADLVYHHHSEARPVQHAGYKFVAQFKSPDDPLVTGRMEARNATVWYRALTKPAYQYLKKNDEMIEEDAYGGIATNSTYCEEYMKNLGDHNHLIQFNFHDVKFYDLMAAYGDENRPVEEPKAEGNGGTFGLGNTGHYSGAGRAIFNTALQDKYDWKLVRLYLQVK